MDNFKVIYKILKVLEDAMDYAFFDEERILVGNLGGAKERRDALMADECHAKGVSVKEYVDGDRSVLVRNIRITMKGLKYLNDNGIMKKVAATMKGIKEPIPSL